MNKTAGNILVFLGSAGIIANAVEYLARMPVTIPVLPISIALLVIGTGLIKNARKTDQTQES